jgi:hypothetical protein
MSDFTLPTDPDEQAAFLTAHGAPNFIKSVGSARANGASVVLTLRAFHHEPDVLYVALDYARQQNVSVTLFAADDETRSAA